ncbi:hypothetical protein [Telluribacter humicola]|uniref:hypothetical protein n=1 Tax=Telluribacter humicola TaxID=1720261 RepID=UPI001A9595E6|nr:hypothetical protein [Telluribacter humicola]
MTVHWKTNGWQSEYRLFREKTIVGILKKNFWGTNAYGEYHGHLLRFQTRGLWNPVTRILDIEGTRELGKIECNTWRTTARITYEDQTFEWKRASWSSRWSVSNEEEQVNYQQQGFLEKQGVIEYEWASPAIILCGLFIS